MKHNRQGKRSTEHKVSVQDYIRRHYRESPEYIAAETGVTVGRVREILKNLHLRARDLQFRSTMSRPPAEYSNR